MSTKLDSKAFVSLFCSEPRDLVCSERNLSKSLDVRDISMAKRKRPAATPDPKIAPGGFDTQPLKVAGQHLTQQVEKGQLPGFMSYVLKVRIKMGGEIFKLCCRAILLERAVVVDLFILLYGMLLTGFVGYTKNYCEIFQRAFSLRFVSSTVTERLLFLTQRTLETCTTRLMGSH